LFIHLIFEKIFLTRSFINFILREYHIIKKITLEEADRSGKRYVYLCEFEYISYRRYRVTLDCIERCFPQIN